MSPALVRQFGRFALVGLSNTAASWVAYAALLTAGLEPAVAAAGAFSVGAANGYLWNSRWTFRVRAGGPTLLRYLAVQLAGLGATALLVWALSPSAGRFGGYALATAVVTVATFAANRWWTFAPPAHSRLTDRSQSRLSGTGCNGGGYPAKGHS